MIRYGDNFSTALSAQWVRRNGATDPLTSGGMLTTDTSGGFFPAEFIPAPTSGADQYISVAIAQLAPGTTGANSCLFLRSPNNATSGTIPILFIGNTQMAIYTMTSWAAASLTSRAPYANSNGGSPMVVGSQVEFFVYENVYYGTYNGNVIVSWNDSGAIASQTGRYAGTVMQYASDGTATGVFGFGNLIYGDYRPVNDVGAALDAAAVTASAFTSDTAAASDAATSIRTSATETATAADSASIRTPVTETGTAVDGAVVGHPATDTAAAVDSTSISIGWLTTDAAAGTDTGSIGAIASDTAAALDSNSVTATTPATETAAAADSGAVRASATDTAAATESTSIRTTAADSAGALDSGAVSATTPATDSATGADAASVRARASDTAAVADSTSVLVGWPISDAAAAAEAGRIRIFGTDSAAGHDLAVVRHAGEGAPARLRLIKVFPRLPVWTGPV